MNDATEESRHVVQEFWAAMNSNDFGAAGRILHDDYILEWPQSGERIRGRDDFVAVNQNYPAAGRWEFDVHRLVADGDHVATDVTVTDGETVSWAITFFTVKDGRISLQTKYWPDPFEPAS